MQTVKVIPVPGGWFVESQVAAPTAFLSGAAAERKAQELARLLAVQDQAQVLIHDRRGSLVGSTILGDHPVASHLGRARAEGAS
jgi:hypothetical protein